MLNIILIINYLIQFTLTCGSDGNSCDEWSPCCSSHGFCGSGYMFCGIGCQKEFTIFDDNSNTACLLPPACSSQMYEFKDASRLQPFENYTGDYRKVDWATTGITEIQNDNLLIKMPKGSGGGRITSTRYVNFAKITARLKTSRLGGVVTSFITMAEDKDEIDFEWIGSDLQQSQTNYYYQGILDLTKGMKHGINSSTYDQFHDYTIDWKPEELNWLVDGNVIRTLKKQDTMKDGKFNYPSSPSRVEIGLWDGGIGAQGTREWAGGYINWDDPEVVKTGYLFMTLQSVNVECYGPPTSSDDDFKLVFEGRSNLTGKVINANENNGESGLNVKTIRNASNAFILLPSVAILSLLFSFLCL